VGYQNRRRVGLAMVPLFLAGGVLVLRATSSRGPALDGANSISNALHSFVYVGEAKCISLESPPHDSDSKPFPAAYLADHCYVFHVPISTPQELYSALESLLIDNGIRVTRAPRTAADFVYLMSGGPLFQIQFQQGRRQGTLTTLQHRRLSDSDPNLPASFRQEDLVLRYSR
jgi:hypothetical protein